jgi:hypothetical protein
MSMQTWVETLMAAQVDGVALTNSTTATSLLGGTGTGASAAKVTLPANWFQIGRVLRVRAAGRISTVVTTPGTLTLDLRMGAVIAANGGAMTLSTTAKTNVAWDLEWLLTCRSIGSGTTTTLMHQGKFTSEAAGATTVVGEAKVIMLPQSAPAVGTGFDGTASQTIDLFGTWSVANAANSIQLHQYTVEALN